MWIRRLEYGSARQDFEAFGRGMTLRTQRTDLIGAFRLLPFVFELTDEAATAHMAEDRPRSA
jgi:hypothetical protein